MKEFNSIIIETEEKIEELKGEIFDYSNKHFGEIHFKVLDNEYDQNNTSILVFKDKNRIGSINFTFRTLDMVHLPEQFLENFRCDCGNKEKIFSLVGKIFK